MTFEQQVGDAIVGCLAPGLMWLTPNGVAQFRNVLAPRVAAAIAAAHGSQGNKARELLQQAALRALRGETP